MSLKVCHISTVHKATDGRIYVKECSSLAQKAYDVSLIAPCNVPFSPDNVNYIPFPDYNNRFKRIFVGSFKMLYLSLKNKSKVYHFHDPELMFVGSILSILGKKVIYDVHEDLPKQVLSKDWISFSWIRKIASFCIFIVEKIASVFFSGIVAATEDIAKKFPDKKTIILRNFPLVSMIKEGENKSKNNQHTDLIYAGGIFKIRGIEKILEAINILNGKASLTLLGDFESDELFESCKNSDGWKYVDFRGWVPLSEVFEHISNCDIGLVTLFPVKNYLKSLPVKAFEYMAMGKPMIMSDFDYWKEMFSSCALFVDPKSPVDIVAKIEYLISNPEEANKLGENGKHLVLQQFSWESEQQKLFYIYDRLF